MNIRVPTVQTFNVNSNNDLFIGTDGNLSIVYDINAVLDVCKQVAQTRLGEVVLQTNIGIPYFTVVWVGVPNLAAFEGALRSAWLSVQGVLRIVDLVTNQQNVVHPISKRTVNAVVYSATIETIFGIGNIASENIFNG